MKKVRRSSYLVILDAIKRLRVRSDQVVELRGLNVPMAYGRPGIVSGYFDDHTQLAKAAVKVERRGAEGIYITLNKLNPALLARAANHVQDRPANTTTDKDITHRLWLPIDLDPVRPAGVSASQSEVKAAKQRSKDVVGWVEKHFQAKPEIVAFSGNGYHLLYRIDLPNDENATEWVRNTLNAIADDFSDGAVKIDRTVFNAARIWKLYGTKARKGDEVLEQGRIHRRARILKGRRRYHDSDG